jgi:hypothetical protein
LKQKIATAAELFFCANSEGFIQQDNKGTNLAL